MHFSSLYTNSVKMINHGSFIYPASLCTFPECRLIENEYLGLSNGILDQSAILLSRQGCLTFMDCKVPNFLFSKQFVLQKYMLYIEWSTSYLRYVVSARLCSSIVNHYFIDKSFSCDNIFPLSIAWFFPNIFHVVVIFFYFLGSIFFPFSLCEVWTWILHILDFVISIKNGHTPKCITCPQQKQYQCLNSNSTLYGVCYLNQNKFAWEVVFRKRWHTFVQTSLRTKTILFSMNIAELCICATVQTSLLLNFLKCWLDFFFTDQRIQIDKPFKLKRGWFKWSTEIIQDIIGMFWPEACFDECHWV